MTPPTSSPAPYIDYPLPESLCYLNGRYGRVCDTQISVMDRGFIFGDGVYEVLPAYSARVFCFEQHMARLDRSLQALRIPNPLERAEWQAIARRLIDDLSQTTGATNQLIYIQVTRGIAPRDHVMLPGLKPTVYVMASEMKLASEAQREQGVACVTADDFRWKKADIKAISLLGAVFARQISADADALETVMFRDGMLSEAAASNVWVVKNGVVLGPPKDNLVLEGIRFSLIERICREQGIAFELRPIGRAEALAADELLLSSATKEVLPVTQLDGRPVGTGKPGPVYARLYAGYQAIKAAECA
ncbi:D-amino acid aminotransferase [Hydrogenophaga crassostreae]|uniref:D-amino acid aminotransferase n=1 Tax=Hydrogenophaga crassostreae TaxID=1763535 RepID=A0A167HCK2_9BURK|nr:D-amino acid aminotransferase [Hydrogenophaga crassostreae]AOW12019.1 D-amino acid aminotransferase [Hydrogenophaga crassostreae]OAD40964.1 D-amino acid aminotransferase [Hydrogenophaga crassostreae]